MNGDPVVVKAPAKINLLLHVSPPRSDGLHPIDSLVQTIEWCDRLVFQPARDGRDLVSVANSDLDPEDNLVVRAIRAVRSARSLPPVEVDLVKEIPMQAGLGGGSSDAAATLVGAQSMGAHIDSATRQGIAASLGADVPLFFKGGTLRLGGVGELVEEWPPLSGFAVAVVVPEFGMDTAAVYRQWDRMEGPAGELLEARLLPPQLRDLPLRNDLLPAALSLEPTFGDLIADLRAAWEVPVAMTGSGSACFGLFPTASEAQDAVDSVAHLVRVGRGVELRESGVEVISK